MHKLPLLFSLVVLLASCQAMDMSDDAHGHGHGHGHDDEHGHNDDHGPENRVTLTQTQLGMIGLAMASPRPLKMSGHIYATGVVDVPPDQMMTLHALDGGFVEDVPWIAGDPIRQGQTLITVRHPDIATEQLEYLNLKAQFAYINAELARQQQLLDGNAIAARDYQATLAQHTAQQGELQRRRLQLEAMGFNVDALTVEKVTDKMVVRAPKSGFVTDVLVSRGQRVIENTPLITLINYDHVHLELQIYEQDLPHIQEGGRVSYTAAGLGGQPLQAKIIRIGQQLDPTSKTVLVHAHLEGPRPKGLMQGLFVEARIWTDAVQEVALPQEAVVQEAGQHYVFRFSTGNSEGKTFERLTVGLGQEQNGWVAVRGLGTGKGSARFATKGAYFLQAELQKHSIEHSH